MTGDPDQVFVTIGGLSRLAAFATRVPYRHYPEIDVDGSSAREAAGAMLRHLAAAIDDTRNHWRCGQIEQARDDVGAFVARIRPSDARWRASLSRASSSKVRSGAVPGAGYRPGVGPRFKASVSVRFGGLTYEPMADLHRRGPRRRGGTARNRPLDPRAARVDPARLPALSRGGGNQRPTVVRFHVADRALALAVSRPGAMCWCRTHPDGTQDQAALGPSAAGGVAGSFDWLLDDAVART